MKPTRIRLAEGFARAVRGVPDERLDRVLKTPARRVVLGAIFWQMPRHFDRKRAASVNGTIAFEITGRTNGSADVYSLTIADGGARMKRGKGGPDPRVTIALSATEFLRLASGGLDPVQAYFAGKIKLTGDIMLAASLQSMFRIPGQR